MSPGSEEIALSLPHGKLTQKSKVPFEWMCTSSQLINSAIPLILHSLARNAKLWSLVLAIFKDMREGHLISFGLH